MKTNLALSNLFVIDVNAVQNSRLVGSGRVEHVHGEAGVGLDDVPALFAPGVARCGCLKGTRQLDGVASACGGAQDAHDEAHKGNKDHVEVLHCCVLRFGDSVV